MLGLRWYSGDSPDDRTFGRLTVLRCTPDCDLASTCAASARTPPAPVAAADAPADPRVTTWRHGYRTGITQTIEQLRRLAATKDGPRIELEDALSMLEAWASDPS
jgi:hypothetical protein